MSELKYQYFTGKFEGHDKTVLFYQSWRPVFSEKTIVIVHGLGEHSGRYQNLIDSFSDSEVGFYAYDHRGHGRSAGQRGYVRSFSDLTNDLRAFLKLVSVHENDRPIILFGHSLGGLICLQYLIECASKSSVVPSALVLSNPTLKISVEVPRWKEVLSDFFARFLPRLALHNELDLTSLSHDESVSKALKADKYCHQKITARFYHEMLDSIEFVKNHAELISVPTLFLVGKEDRIIDPKGTEAFFETLDLAKKTLKQYPTFYHELINEIGKEKVFSDIKSWMGEHESTR